MSSSRASSRDQLHGASPAPLGGDPLEVVDQALHRFFRLQAPLDPGDALLVAFSGGPDSTVLLAAAVRFGERRGVRVVAAHLDHGMDAGSSERARAALRLASKLGAPCTVERRPVGDLRKPGESLEAAARRVRYRYLADRATREAARWIATAHHRDDQVETVLLRLAFGSGWQGLAGILPVRKAASEPGIVRPFLDLPRLQLAAALRAEELPALEDPSNLDLAPPRNRLRHVVLPRLESKWPGLGSRVARLADTARLVREKLADRISAALDVRSEAGSGPLLGSADLESLMDLPRELVPVALATLHREAGIVHPPGQGAIRELRRQLRVGDPGCSGVECGGGLRWEARGHRLALVRAEHPTPAPRFAYTLQVPGELILGEVGVGFRITRGRVAPWMFRSSEKRAGLLLPIGVGDRVGVRNRRHGDRFRPLGAPGRRRLKEVLIDRKVPRDRRDRLPLLIVRGHIAWVPGVAVGERFRLPGDQDRRREGDVWIVEIFEP